MPLAGTREQYRGSFLQAIDGKGRVAIPAAFRASAEANAPGKTLLLTPHSTSICLTAYDEGWSEELKADLRDRQAHARTSGKVFDREVESIDAVAGIDELSYDSSGRFILPAFPRKKAKLSDLALFVGAIDTFQIWNPQQFLDSPINPAHIKERVDYMLAERSAA